MDKKKESTEKVFLKMLNKYKLAVTGIIAGSLALSLVVYNKTPKAYKAKGSVAIYSQYFLHSLINDFVTESSDSSEIRSQREAIIKQAINWDFIDQIGAKYSLFKHPEKTVEHEIERQELMKAVEIVPLNNMTYQISFTGKEALQTFDINNEAIEQILKTLKEERRKKLISIRNAIGIKIEKLGLQESNKKGVSISEISKSSLESELNLVKKQIEILSRQYTSQHPEFKKLVSKEKSLKAMIKNLPADSVEDSMMDLTAPETATAGIDSNSTTSSYSELLKKYNYLGVLIQTENSANTTHYSIIQKPVIPTAPISPIKLLFLIGGFLTGVVLSFAYIFTRYLNEAKSGKMILNSSLGNAEIIEESNSNSMSDSKKDKTKAETDAWIG